MLIHPKMRLTLDISYLIFKQFEAGPFWKLQRRFSIPEPRIFYQSDDCIE